MSCTKLACCSGGTTKSKKPPPPAPETFPPMAPLRSAAGAQLSCMARRQERGARRSCERHRGREAVRTAACDRTKSKSSPRCCAAAARRRHRRAALLARTVAEALARQLPGSNAAIHVACRPQKRRSLPTRCAAGTAAGEGWRRSASACLTTPGSPAGACCRPSARQLCFFASRAPHRARGGLGRARRRCSVGNGARRAKKTARAAVDRRSGEC